jgi:hypothetical protein
MRLILVGNGHSGLVLLRRMQRWLARSKLFGQEASCREWDFGSKGRLFFSYARLCFNSDGGAINGELL